MKKQPSPTESSWQNVERWYDSIVGVWGHYYHTNVIIPNLKKILHFTEGSSLLDLACGQGVLARHLPKILAYTGIDASHSLIKKAKEYNAQNGKCKFLQGDITKPLPLKKELFSHSTIVLALQNIEEGQKVIQNVKQHLKEHAQLVIVLNHPCYRIPRQSSWGFNENAKVQYRQINAYMTPQKIPIVQNPGGKEKSETTWSFHHPLSSYFQWLHAHNFVITNIHEWCSDKTSTGKAAKWENRARKEFPLFLTIEARYEGEKE
jgi:ubiquinone/menaquinone biosynthesis C-methylase UbiE